MDKEIADLAGRFVCVRLVQMRGVDLGLFQFDYDLTWAAFFMNADLEIYGRYGTRNSGKEGASRLYSLGALKNAMRRALELHKGYPANRALLKGKKGARPPWRTVERMPAMARRFQGKDVRASCIHCHHAYEGMRRSLPMVRKRLSPRDVWVYPLPENIGIRIDPRHGTRVQEVEAASPAWKAGLRAGDRIDVINGQPILSIADIQWVLHNVPDKTELGVRIAGGKTLRIAPAGPWRKSDLSWRESTWALRPGLWLVGLSDAERAGLGLARDRLALRVKWILPEGKGAAAGFREGDVVVEVDGVRSAMTESEFLAHVRLEHSLASKVPVVVLRGGRRVRLPLPLR